MKNLYLVFIIICLNTPAFAANMGNSLDDTVNCGVDTQMTSPAASSNLNIEEILQRPKTAEFEVSFGEEFENYENVIEAKNALQFALDIYSREIVSSVPIKLSVRLPSNTRENRLAFAQPEQIIGDGTSLPAGISYHSALADSIAQRDLQPEEEYDIRIFFEPTLGPRLNWNFSTIASEIAPNEISFVTVTLHELTHALGFVGTGRTPNRLDELTRHVGSDIVVGDLTVRQVVDEIIGADANMQNFEFFGLYASAWNKGEPLNTADQRSHLNPDIFPTSLMKPNIPLGQHIFDIGNDTRGILRDLGWKLNNPSVFPIRTDKEKIIISMDSNTSTVENVTFENVTNQPVSVSLDVTSQSGLARILSSRPSITIEANAQVDIAIEIDSPELNGRHDIGFLQINVIDAEQLLSIPIVVNRTNGVSAARLVSNLPLNFEYTTFGDGPVNQEFKGAYLQNYGDEDLSFFFASGPLAFTSISPLQGTIPPGGFQHINVTLDRTNILTSGKQEELIFLITNDPSPQRSALEVTSNLELEPRLQLSNSSLDITIDVDDPSSFEQAISFDIIDLNWRFGPALQLQVEEKGSSENQASTLLNNINISGPIFVDGNRNRTVTASVNLSGMQLGNYSTTLVVKSNDPVFSEIEVPINLSLVSSDGRYVTLDQNDIDFGAIDARDITQSPVVINKVVNVNNLGTRAVRITDIQTDNTAFKANSQALPVYLQPGQSLAVTVSYFPSFDQPETALLTITTNAVQETLNAIIEGRGISREGLGILSADTNVLFFDDVQVGEPAVNNVTYTNMGNSAITLTEVNAVNGDSAISVGQIQTPNNDNIVEPGESVIIPVIFTAQHVGPIRLNGMFNTALEVNYDVSVSNGVAGISDKITTRLFGYATDGPAFLRLDGLNSDFGAIEIGSSAVTPAFDVFGFNDTDTDINIDSITISDNVNFELVETIVFDEDGEIIEGVIPPFSEFFQTVRFSPKTAGRFTAIVTISSEDLPVPFEITYKGEGVIAKPNLQELVLIDVATQQEIQKLTDGAVIDLANFGEVTIQAISQDTEPKSVLFVLDGNAQRLDNRAPFSIGGEKDGVLRAFDLALGTHTLAVSPNSELLGKGETGESIEITFTVVDSRRPSVTGFALIHADDPNTQIELLDGVQINLNNYSSNAFTVVALIGDIPATKVRFDYNGKDKFNFDSRSPFSLAGGGTRFKTIALPLGVNTVSATPFSGRDSKGRLQEGVKSSISFNVIQ